MPKEPQRQEDPPPNQLQFTSAHTKLFLDKMRGKVMCKREEAQGFGPSSILTSYPLMESFVLWILLAANCLMINVLQLCDMSYIVG